MGCCLITPDDPSGVAVRRLVEAEGVTALCGDEGWFRSLNVDPVFTAAGYEAVRQTMDCAALARRDGDGLRFLNPGRTGEPKHIPRERIGRS